MTARSQSKARSPAEAQPFPAAGHDHGPCIEAALDNAAELCRRRRARLTPIRRRVLELIWRGHRPLGAYDLLAMLRRERRGAAPPTVYRALDFLVELGLVHRIESLNSFVGCPDPNSPHGGQFLICRQCGTSAELNDAAIERAVMKSAAEAGFDVARPMIEVEGLCPNCRT